MVSDDVDLLEELIDEYTPQGVVLGLAEACRRIGEDLEADKDYTRAPGWIALATYLEDRVAYAGAVVRAS